MPNVVNSEPSPDCGSDNCGEKGRLHFQLFLRAGGCTTDGPIFSGVAFRVTTRGGDRLGGNVIKTTMFPVGGRVRFRDTLGRVLL